MTKKDITDRLRSSFRDPENGVVVVSPRLLVEAAEEIERLRLALNPPHGRPEKLRIYINRKIASVASPNKIAAHAVHAALTAFGVHPGVKVVVLDKGPTVIEGMRTVIHDAGHTELEPGTLTAGTDWPKDSAP